MLVQERLEQTGIPTVALEQAHVEDIMKTRALLKLKTVGDVVDALQDVERSGIPGTELPFCARHQRLGRAVEQP